LKQLNQGRFLGNVGHWEVRIERKSKEDAHTLPPLVIWSQNLKQLNQGWFKGDVGHWEV
jgi:hypothetical protein